MVYKRLRVDITEAQVNQALKGKAVRLKPSQINSGETFLSLHPENAKKVQNALLKKKGCTIYLTQGELATTAHEMGGSGFWGKVWSGLKSVWKVLKDTGALSSLADMAVAPIAAYTGQPALASAGRKILKDTTGIGVKPARMTKSDKYAQLKASGIYLS